MGQHGFSGYDKIIIFVKNGYFEGKEGTTKTKSLPLKVKAVRDTPAILGPEHLFKTPEDTFLVMSGLHVVSSIDKDSSCFKNKNKEHRLGVGQTSDIHYANIV